MISKVFACLLLSAATLFPATAEPFRHSTGQWREYHRDWLAACPDTISESADAYENFSCFASTYSQQTNSANLPAYVLTIIRNRLNGEFDIAITLADDSRTPDTSRPLVLEFTDGSRERLQFSGDLETRYNMINQFFVVDRERKAALLDLLREGSSLRLIVPVSGLGRSVSTTLSLRGVTASIDFMEAYARKLAQY